ncbi:MAG: PA14 domain-containing protein [Limisphaerales bacterium]
MASKLITKAAFSMLALGLGAILSQAAAPATPQGFVTAKRFDSIAGTTVADLTGNAKFPGSPDAVIYPTWFEYPPGPDIDTAPPGDSGMDNYGVQITGYFYPETTGDYVFRFSADDGAHLYLSTDSDPANRKLIAQEAGWSNPRSYTAVGGGSVLEEKSSATFAGTQWSTKDEVNGGAKITLTQGQAYYIEALMKEGGGGDNLSVTIDDPDSGLALPIPGSRLSPFGVAASSSITSQPQDAAVYAGSTAAFSVGVDVPPPATLTSIKWQKNGVDIPNSDTNRLTVAVVAADNGAKFKAIITTSAGTLTSAEGTLTVAEFTNEFAVGVVKFEAYHDIGGTAIQGLLDSEKFPDQPDNTMLLTGIDTPSAYGENYGARVSGFIIPPESGDYHFFIRSDDASQFFLSANETPPDPMELQGLATAEETGCCQAFLEPGALQTTADPIALVAGRKYAFVALLKEGGGGDFLQVAARKEGDATAAANLRPLSGVWIGANAKPNLGTPQITKQPESLPQLVAGTIGQLSLEASVTPTAFNFPVVVQWRKNGTAIPGATALTYTIANATTADNGTYSAVVSAPSGQSVTSTDAVVTVVTDAFPPKIVGVGALPSQTGTTFDVGVSFDEPVTPASAGNAANYTLSAGTISGVTFYAGSPGVVLKVSGLTAGTTYTVTVANVSDTAGNVMTATAKEFKVSGMKWGVVGANEVALGNGVLAVAENEFDVYSDGIGEWANYDESTFVYEEITGDFDKVLRVEYQDSSSQWARAGLIARDVTNFGVDRDTQATEAGRYQKVHVNPVTTAMGTAGNNSWEGNRRLSTGAATTSAGGGGTPLYPNAWCRLQRVGDVFTIYRSDDGVTWTQLGTTTFADEALDIPPMPAKLFVGPEFSPENGNIPVDSGLRGVWVAKFRDYGTYNPVTTPTVSITTAGVITYTGVLQSSATVNGTYAPVAGAVSPYTAPKTGAAMFYRAASQ